MGSHVSIKKHQINKTILSAIANLNVQRTKKLKVLALLKNQIVEEMLNKNEEAALKSSESYIKTENYILSYEVLSTFCEQIKSQINIIEQKPTIPKEMVTTYASIIYAAPLCDIDEIPVLRKQIELMYGDKFIKECISDKSNKNVHEILKMNLNKKVISHEEKIYKIQSILKQVGINYQNAEKNKQEQFPKPNKIYQENVINKDNSYNVNRSSSEAQNNHKNPMELYPSLTDFNSYMSQS